MPTDLICATDPMFSSNGNNTSSQVIPSNSVVSMPAGMANTDPANLPPPPPLIPISEVLQVCCSVPVLTLHFGVFIGYVTNLLSVS